MHIRHLFPLLLLLAGLSVLFFSCVREEAPPPPLGVMKAGGGGTEPPSWPPDTLMVKLVGSGKLLVIAAWKADSAGVPPMRRFLEGSVTVEHDTTPNVHPNPVPGPGPGLIHPSATVAVKKIMDRPMVWRTVDALVLNPDTSYAR